MTYKEMQKLISELRPLRHEKIGIENVPVYEFYDFQLADYTKKIAQICISLCRENSISGKGTNSCQHDIDAIKKYFDIDNDK
jgi:hypothetical protein